MHSRPIDPCANAKAPPTTARRTSDRQNAAETEKITRPEKPGSPSRRLTRDATTRRGYPQGAPLLAGLVRPAGQNASRDRAQPKLCGERHQPPLEQPLAPSRRCRSPAPAAPRPSGPTLTRLPKGNSMPRRFVDFPPGSPPPAPKAPGHDDPPLTGTNGPATAASGPSTPSEPPPAFEAPGGRSAAARVLKPPPDASGEASGSAATTPAGQRPLYSGPRTTFCGATTRRSPRSRTTEPGWDASAEASCYCWRSSIERLRRSQR